MRPAKPPAPEGATGSSRRQPVRQTRVNPPRTSSLNRLSSIASGPAPEQPINILPGVTHFSDAITALPKELVRHFTLLKEVDAKIFAPEAALFQLLEDALNTPSPDFARPLNDASSSAASVSAATNAQTGAARSANPQAPPSDGSASSVFDPANIPRRTLFRDTALKIQEMLVSLEEKNHVISTANDALQKQLSRIEDIWPHLEAEFSEEAKWGSATHWAYVENRQAKANDKQAERSRREGAATLSAAAQALADDAAARSNDRKQAMAAKKNSKNQAAADAEGDKAQDAGKKAQGPKSRKPLPDSGPVGLGITPGPPGGAPTNKRRKPEPKTNGGAPMERAMGTVYGGNASKQRTTSPRETPAPDSGSKKRKALPTSSNQAKKSRTSAAMSPSVTSSPLVGTFPDPVKPGRASPAPSATAPRPVSSRARQNSTQSNAENPRQPLPSAVSNKPGGNLADTPDLTQPSHGSKINTDTKVPKETNVPIMTKSGLLKPETEETPPMLELAPSSSKKEIATKAGEESGPQKEAASLAIQPTPAGIVKTKSGRASKPSTPAIATFAEAVSTTAATAATTTTTTTTTSRSRPSRNAESGTSTAPTSTTATTTTTTNTTTKRSHKKGASISATAAAVAQQAAAAAASASASSSSEKEKDKDAAPTTTGGGTSTGSRKLQDKTADTTHGHARSQSQSQNQNQSQVKAAAADVDDDDDDDDQDPADEDLYCYCNQVSYGEMVGCDGEGCQREWFHLGCVGLKVAPKSNVKWYCEDCKKRLKIGESRR